MALLELAFPDAVIATAERGNVSYHTTPGAGRVPGIAGAGRIGDMIGLFFLGTDTSAFIPLAGTTVESNTSMGGYHYTIVHAASGRTHTFLSGSDDLLRVAQLGSVGQLV